MCKYNLGDEVWLVSGIEFDRYSQLSSIEPSLDGIAFLRGEILEIKHRINDNGENTTYDVRIRGCFNNDRYTRRVLTVDYGHIFPSVDSAIKFIKTTYATTPFQEIDREGWNQRRNSISIGKQTDGFIKRLLKRITCK